MIYSLVQRGVQMLWSSCSPSVILKFIFTLIFIIWQHFLMTQQQRNQWTCLCSVLSVFLALVKISMMNMDTPMVIITRNKWHLFLPLLRLGKNYRCRHFYWNTPNCRSSDCWGKQMQRKNESRRTGSWRWEPSCVYRGHRSGAVQGGKEIIKGPVRVHRSTLLAPTSSRRAIDPIAFALWGQRKRK